MLAVFLPMSDIFAPRRTKLQLDLLLVDSLSGEAIAIAPRLVLAHVGAAALRPVFWIALDEIDAPGSDDPNHGPAAAMALGFRLGREVVTRRHPGCVRRDGLRG